MRDTNGDLKMDTKESITDRYGRRARRAERQRVLLGHGQLMHTSESDIQLVEGPEVRSAPDCREANGASRRTTRAASIGTPTSRRYVDFVPTPYFTRNPALLRTRGSYEALRDEENNVNTVAGPAESGTNRAYQSGIDRPDGTWPNYCGVRAADLSRRPSARRAVGQRLRRGTRGQSRERIIIEDDGKMLRARKAHERGEFLASTDERFRPVYLSNAPDGTLHRRHVRGVVQQRDTTEHLRDHITSQALEQPTGLGRIYRVMHATTTRDTRSTAPSWLRRSWSSGCRTRTAGARHGAAHARGARRS